MAFQIIEYKFGKERGLMITSDQHKHHVDILPSYGALLARVEFFGLPIVEPFNSYDELIEDHWYRNFWLLPFQNRVRDGKYVFEEKPYQLEVNEVDRNNAIHGFFQSLKATNIFWETAEDEALITIKHTYNGDLPGYPFKFETQFDYKISEKGSIEMNFEIKNIGNINMPFSIGFHPYFQLDGEKQDWTLGHGSLINHILDDRNLPTGEKEEIHHKLSLKNATLDHSYSFLERPHKILLESKKYSLEMHQSENLPFLQVFTPPRNSVALEPLSSGVDAFNTKEGLSVIPSSETLNGWVKIGLSIK